MRLLLALGRKETVHIAPVPKHLQRVLGFPVGRLQHQEHDAKVCFHIAGIKPVGLLHNSHTASGSAVECLPVGVLAILHVLQSLGVDRLVRHDPENESGVAVEIAPHNPGDGGNGEPSLAAARRHLQHGVRHGPVTAVHARRERNSGAGRWKFAVVLQCVPCLLGEVGDGKAKIGVACG